MKKIKVLQMVPSLNYGGSQSMIVNIYNAMNRDNIEFDFVVDHPALMEMKPIVEKLGCKVYSMPTFKGTNILEVKKAWNSFFKQHQEYDILHSHVRSYASVFMPIASKYGLKTIIHSQNTSNGKGQHAFIKDLMQLPLRFTCDYFLACSKEAGLWLFGNRIVKGSRFHVLKSGIDTEKYGYDKTIRDEYRKTFGIKDELVLIQAGRFVYQKNYEFTVRVFNKFLKKNKNTKLFLIGVGETKKNIMDMVKNLNIIDKVIFLEARDDLNKLYMMSDIFLMPSHFEGISVAALEAQATGIKCLFSDQIDPNTEITDVCTFLKLDEETWLDNLYADNSKRTNKKKEVLEAGYDVYDSANWLEKFYRSIL